jgi:hypothetical protein
MWVSLEVEFCFMKKYERKINHIHDVTNLTICRSPEKLSLDKITEYTKADKLSLSENELTAIQSITYTLSEIMYLSWVKNRKQNTVTESTNTDQNDKESHFIYPSEHRRAS